MDLWLVGYGAWSAPTRAARLVEALVARGVTHLVDVRLCPCAFDPTPGRPYGPKPWNLQAGSAGIVGRLAQAGIGYTWMVELGNPQRQDRDGHSPRPSRRRRRRVARSSRPGATGVDAPRGGATYALLCACGDGSACHRTVVAQALNARHFAGTLTLREVVARRIAGDGRGEGR